MAEKRRQDSRRSHASCNISKTALEDTSSKQPKNGGDVEKSRLQLNMEKATSSSSDFTDGLSSKDTNEAKYIDHKDINKACQMQKERQQADVKQSKRPEPDDITQENKNSVKMVSMNTPDSEKEEGHYEELVCLVRQFYVERPVNPAAIAYQNIETC
ncbi:uncharacterized protein [Montipora capricornis]|uniref:uncharacterized protein n=1 Tax=Montipora capricornis TaxID=246305 RepID=UPI0035F11A8B